MDILVVGNGFDLAHELPTTYKDFLKFIEQIKRIETFQGTAKEFTSKIEQTGYDKFNELDQDVARYIMPIITDAGHPVAKVCDTHIKYSNDIIAELINLSKNNYWIKRFQGVLIKEGWVDFEHEISMTVQCFEKLHKMQSLEFLDKQNLSDYENQVISAFALKGGATAFLPKFDFLAHKKTMIDDLNALIRCFELYLEDCVKNIDKGFLSPDIYNLKVQKVLSFNYTDTYFRFYSCKNRNIEYDYIHGKSKLHNKRNNMVLGIDEYLEGSECYSNIDYIQVKKYFQRIHKTTGCSYKRWIEDITASKDPAHNIYIFGHSLSMTDKDVLRELLKHEKTKTTIYYKDSKHYGELIANLVQVLGPDTLIALVHGTHPKIVFQIQQEMINRVDSEWQILNDRNSLWRLYELSDSEINTLINRIHKCIKECDSTYFYNQRNIISLYDALINNYSETDTSALLEIAKILYSTSDATFYDINEWNDFDYYGEVPCNRKVVAFIRELNEYNASKRNETLQNINLDNLSDLDRKISNSTLGEKQAFDLLFPMFKDNNSNIGLIWKCIFSLRKKITNSTWKKFVNKKLTETKGVDHLRFRHIQDDIDESDYYENMRENYDDHE